MTSCPLCEKTALGVVLDRDGVPTLQNALARTEDEARAVIVGELHIRACRTCGFVFNASFDPDLAKYGTTYENDQTISASFARHVDAMAARVLSSLRENQASCVLEVGSGQGYFLTRLREQGKERVSRAIGFDPAWRGGDPPGGVSLHARIFDATEAAHLAQSPDIVISRHVIEHVRDPLAFLRSIRAALSSLDDVRVFLETPCVRWILDNRVLQDFFYEHCSYFTAETLRFALEQTGFEVDAVEQVFEGQYLWAAARTRKTSSRATEPDRDVARVIASAAEQFRDACDVAVAKWRERLSTTASMTAIWGAGAKGVTFATTIDPTRSLIDCVVDVNPRKQGTFVPLTGHPVVSPDAARARGVTSAIVMNPNYADEIARWAAENEVALELLLE